MSSGDIFSSGDGADLASLALLAEFQRSWISCSTSARVLAYLVAE